MSIKIKELPEMERPYEKLEMYGAKRLSNAELLAIIIKSGTKEHTSVQLAQQILNLNQTKQELNFLKDLEIEDFMKIKGIGKVKAIQLKAVCELTNRMATPLNYKKTVIKTPKDLVNILMQELRFEKVERLKVVLLDNKNRILKIVDIGTGRTDGIDVKMREVLAEPIRHHAPKIIIVHNHPTGIAKPSVADIQFTAGLLEICEVLGIEIMDHIIIGNMEYTSIFTKAVEFNEQKKNKKLCEQDENIFADICKNINEETEF